MRIVVTGGRGMLGRTLQRRLVGHELSILDLPEVDITDAEGTAAALAAAKPEVVIHCTAMTAVVRASRKRIVRLIQAEGPKARARRR
jgi:dTDP-4-dehydrorhamnose reductase